MGRWQIFETIGDTGGFGKVHRCRKYEDNSSNILKEKDFALKKLNDPNQDSIQRFQREVRLCSKLNHPNIIKVLDANLGNEPYCYVMDLYSSSLQAIMNELKKDLNRVKTVINNVFDGVEYLHSEGVFHRDLKPQNILYNSDDDIVITDFGLGVQPKSETQARITEKGKGMGTQFFCSPEQ